MPFGDRTGRGLGYCAGYNSPGYVKGPGWGFGRGFGRGRRWFWRAWDYAPYPAQPPAEEKRILEEEMKALKERLSAVEKRLKELKAEKKE